MAAEAARCAEEYDKEGQMRMLIFNGQRQWSASSSPQEIWAKYAAVVGANMEKWRYCVSSRAFQSAVETDRKLGLRMGIDATPTIIVGNRKFVGVVPFKDLAASVRAQIN